MEELNAVGIFFASVDKVRFVDKTFEVDAELSVASTYPSSYFFKRPGKTCFPLGGGRAHSLSDREDCRDMAVERGWHAVSQFRLHGSSELLCMHCDLSNMRSSKRYYGHHVTSATVWAHEPQMRLKHRVLGYFTTNDQVLVQDVGLVLMSREEKNVQQKVQFNRGAVGSDRIDILLFIPPEMDVAVTIGEYWIDDLSRMVYICKSLVFNLCLVGVLYLVFRQLKWSYSIDETRGEDVERWYWPLSKLKGLLTCGTGGGNDAKDGEELRFKPHAKFFGSLRICDFNTVFLVFVGIVMPIFGVLQFRGAGGPTFNQFIWYAGLIAFWAFVAFLAAPG
eukprot:500672_1